MTGRRDSAGGPCRWLVMGAYGQLGRCLIERVGAAPGHVVAGAHDLDTLDVTDRDAVLRAVLEAPDGPPDVVANAAAMTQVDRCETEPELAQRANADAPAHLAEACREARARLVHVSTDYVFAGTGSQPYTEEDEPAPRSVYGRTKLEGEARVRAVCPDAIVARTAWVFGPGNNFVRTILAAAARSAAGEGAPLRVVDDQRGSPTYAGHLAAGLLGLLEAGAAGLYHLVNSGVATWWDLARAAVDAGGHADLPIERVRTEEFPRPAPRPAWSVLDTGKAARLGVTLPPWREGLRAYLESDASPLRQEEAFA